MTKNKSGNTYVGSYIPVELYDKLVSISSDKDRTISYLIKNILLDHIDDYMKD